MFIVKLKIIVIIILFSIINNTSAKEKVDTYSVYAKLPLLGEVEVQNIETKMTILDNKIEYSYSVKPTKLIDFFDDKISSGYILGILKNNSITTDNYLFKTEKDDFSRIIKIKYSKGIIDEVTVDPPYDTSKITNVTKKMIYDSIDPVTMFYMITNYEFIKGCDKVINVYDGKRRYDLTLSDPKINDTDYSCTLSHKKIAGYKQEKIEKNKIYVSDLKFIADGNQSYKFSEVSLRNNDTDIIIKKNN